MDLEHYSIPHLQSVERMAINMVISLGAIAVGRVEVEFLSCLGGLGFFSQQHHSDGVTLPLHMIWIVVLSDNRSPSPEP